MTQRVSDADTSEAATYITSHFLVWNTTKEVAPISEHCITRHPYQCYFLFSAVISTALTCDFCSMDNITSMLTASFFLHRYSAHANRSGTKHMRTFPGLTSATILMEDAFLRLKQYSPHQPHSLHWKCCLLYPIIFPFFLKIWAPPDLNVVNVASGNDPSNNHTCFF